VSNHAMQDHEILTGLYRTYGGRVYARCMRLLKNPAEAQDATQEVFVKVARSLEHFRHEASPLTWMTRIATNHCLNVIRAKKAPWHERYRVEVETMGGTVDGGFHLIEHHELLRLVVARVVERDPQLAELATYAFVDDMRQQDICALVGISAPTLRKRLREFITIARDELSAHVPGITFAESPL
jgi:RNA polymerase sigma factor (sigma-70 family)